MAEVATIPVTPIDALVVAPDILADVRRQMNAELDEDNTPVQRGMLLQKYGLIPPVFTTSELAVIENRKKLEAKRRRRAARD
jgi:hypothetical protein